MDIPSEVINAVKTAPKTKRAPHKRNVQKRVLHAVGNGLRTVDAVANALNLSHSAVGKALYVLTNKGHLHSAKKAGSPTKKYYLTTEKPTLDGVNIDIKPKRKYTKRVAKVVKATQPTQEQPTLGRYARELEVKLANITSKVASLELALAEKDKEVWTLECEVFDKKAVIKYLEEKLFQLGVRV